MPGFKVAQRRKSTKNRNAGSKFKFVLLYPLSLLLFPCGKRDHRKTFLWKTTWTDGGGRGGGVVDYGRMRLSRRKISKRSLLLFLLLFRIGGWVDLMGFCPPGPKLFVLLFSGCHGQRQSFCFLYRMAIQQSCFQKGENPYFWTFPERKDFFCLSFPQLKCHGFAYPVSDAEKSPLTS